MFEALEVSLDLARSLWRPVERLRARDRDLSEQIRSAVSALALKKHRSRLRSSRQRIESWREAGLCPAGARNREEVRAALRVALAWGDLEPAEVSGALQLLDRLLAMAWRLTQ